jgi:hypothetical protein
MFGMMFSLAIESIGCMQNAEDDCKALFNAAGRPRNTGGNCR